MAAMIVRLKVADFETWKAEFDPLEALRREHGWIAHEIYRDAADPGAVVIVNHVQDLDRARAYLGLEAVRAAVQRSGVQGPPEVWPLLEAEARQY